MDLKRTGKLVERARQYNTRTFPAADNIQTIVLIGQSRPTGFSVH